MAKKQEPIRTRSFVYVNNEPVLVDSLSPEMKRRVSAELQLRLLNAFFAGEAEFFLIDEKGEPINETV